MKIIGLPEYAEGSDFMKCIYSFLKDISARHYSYFSSYRKSSLTLEMVRKQDHFMQNALAIEIGNIY